MHTPAHAHAPTNMVWHKQGAKRASQVMTCSGRALFIRPTRG